MKKLFSKLIPNKKTNIFAVFLFGILSIVFLSPAIINSKYFAPTDVVRDNQPFLNQTTPHNRVTADVTFQFLPWLKLSKDLLKQGDFPFWNIYSGGGLPLFANMQAATLFPLTWLFFLFNFKIALLLYAFFKLFLLGYFTYLFLKELGLKYEVCLIGGTAFMFANTNIIWLLWPLSSVIIFLPLNFFLIEKILSQDKKVYLPAFVCSITLSIFAGHPQTLFYILFTTGLYCLFRLWEKSDNLRRKFIRLTELITASVIGVGLATLAWLPFLEYLKLSENLINRQQYLSNPFYLQKFLFVTNIIPDFFGNPAYKNFSFMVGYSEQTMGYVGISLLFLALYAFISGYKNKTILFFSSLLFLSYCLIYRFEPIYWLINKLPGFSLNYNNRFQYIWAFGAVILGSLGLNDIMSTGLNKVKFTISTVILLTASIFYSWQARLFSKTLQTPITWHSITNWQNFFFIIFALNLAAGIFIILKAKNNPKWLWVLLLLVFFETGMHGLIFNTNSTDKNFFPSTGATVFLASDFSNNFGKTFSFGNIFLPNLSTWYGFNQVTDYDAFSLKTSWDFKKNIANFNYSPEFTNDMPNIKALEFFGVKNMVYPQELKTILLNKNPGLQISYQDAQVVIFQLNALPRAYIVQAYAASQLQNKIDSLIINPDKNKISYVDKYELLKNGTSLVNYRTDKTSFLITNENYYPGWQALLDGKDNLPVLNISGFKAVSLPTGIHSIKIYYYPKSFVLGIKLSTASLLFFILFIFYSFRARVLKPSNKIIQQQI